jgi:PAS domain-containing protein
MNNQVSLYESMLESAPIGTVAYDAKGQCYFANNVAAEIIGARNKALILQQNYHIIPPGKHPAFMRLF